MGTSHHKASIDDDVALHILHDCDRTRSQEARRALQKLVWQPLQSHNIQLRDPSCPLSPHVDILSLQQSSKTFLHGGIWQCKICGKMFSSEHYLDMHQARRHADMRYMNGTLCLADLCDIYVPCIPSLTENDNGVVKPFVSTTGLLLKSNNDTTSGSGSDKHPSSSHVPPFCHLDSAQRHKELQKRILRCSHVVEDCLQSAIDVQQDRYLYQRHVDRLKSELCQRASALACIERDDIHRQFHPEHIRLSTDAGFPTYYLAFCVVTLTVLFALFFCFCPIDIHKIDRSRKPAGRNLARQQGGHRKTRRRRRAVRRPIAPSHPWG